MSNADKALRSLISEVITGSDEERYKGVRSYLANMFRIKGLHGGLKDLHSALNRDEDLQDNIAFYLAYPYRGVPRTPEEFEKERELNARDSLIKAIFYGAAAVNKAGEVVPTYKRDEQGQKTTVLDAKRSDRVRKVADLSRRLSGSAPSDEAEPAPPPAPGEQFAPPEPPKPIDIGTYQRAVAAAPPAEDIPTPSIDRPQASSFGPVIGGKKGKGRVTGSAVKLAGTTRSVPMDEIMGRMDARDPAYDARVRILSAMSGATSVHRDPVQMLKRAVYGNVSLVKDQSITVGSNIVQDMVLTQEAKEQLLTTTQLQTFRTGAVSVGASPVNARDAEKFAQSLVRAYTSLANKKKPTAGDVTEAVNVALQGAQGAVPDALNALANGYMPGVPNAVRLILSARITSQADDLRPYSAEANEGEKALRRTPVSGEGPLTAEMEAGEEGGRKIRRVTTSLAPSIEKASEEVYDPATRTRRTVTTVQHRKGGATELLIIPREVFGDEKQANKELTPAEALIIDQAAAARAKHTEANGYYLVARALHVMDTERAVLESNKLTAKERQIVIAAYGNLDKALSLHPYGHLASVGDALHAASEVRHADDVDDEEIDAAREKGALFELQDDELGQLQTLSQKAEVARSKADKGAVESMIGVMANGGRFEKENVLKVLQILDENPGYRMSALKRALLKYTDIEATVLVVPRSSGSARTQKIDEGREATELDNESLDAAIDVFLTSKHNEEALNTLSYRLSRLSEVPEGATGGQDIRGRLRSFVISHMKQEGLFPSAIVKKALGIPKDKTLDEKIAAEVRPLAGRMRKFREDMETAEAQQFEIIENSKQGDQRSQKHRAVLTALAATRGSSSTLYDSINRRLSLARSRRSEDTPSDIIMTPRHVLAGALQLAIERNAQFGDRIPVDTFTPYAIPMGPTTGAGAPSASARKSPALYREELARRINGAYKVAMGRTAEVGAEIVIPSLMRTPAEGAVYGNLSLGRGVVRSVQFISRQITQAEIDRAGLSEFVGAGIQVNLMAMTVSFPSGQWRFNGKPHEFADKLGLDRAIAEKVADLDAASDPREIKYLESEISRLRGNASRITIKSNEVATALVQDAPDAQRMISSLVHLDDATGNLTITNVAPAFIDLPSRHLNDLVKYNWPKATAHQGDMTVDDMQRLETIQFNVKLGGKVVNTAYIPASAVTFRPDHTNSPMSPFNTNRLSRGGRFMMEYSAGLDEIKTRVGFAEKGIVLEGDVRGRVMGALSESLKLSLGSLQGVSVTAAPKTMFADKHEAGIAIFVNRTADVAVRAEHGERFEQAFRAKYDEALRDLESDKTLNDAGRIEAAKRIATEHAKEQIGEIPREGGVSESVMSEVRSSAESCRELTSSYEYAGTGEFQGRTGILYALRPELIDPKMHIASVHLTTGEISVGGLVYIQPMYDVKAPKSDSGRELAMANSVSPPELYGIGKVTRIYYVHGADSSNPEDFKAVVADLEFRGDQVKTNGMRGSIRSPNVTLAAVGIAFLRPIDITGMNPDEIRKIDPTSPRRERVEDNYPPQTVQESMLPVVGRAGWLLPSPIDSPRIEGVRRRSIILAAKQGRLKLGSKVRIRQVNHPMSNVVGRLVGFLGPAQLTAEQRGSISETSIRPGAVNAIVQLEEDDVLGKISRILSDLKAGPSDRAIVGTKAVSEEVIKRLFRHIDTNITQRYLANPSGARGYTTYAGSGDYEEMQAEVEAGRKRAADTSAQIAAARSSITDSLKRVNAASPEAWSTYHRSGIAAHPADKGYASYARIEHKPHVAESRPDEIAAGTMFGCSAILHAILEHGPEKTISSIDVHQREMQMVRDFMKDSVSIVRGRQYDRYNTDPYQKDELNDFKKLVFSTDKNRTYPEGALSQEAVLHKHERVLPPIEGSGEMGMPVRKVTERTTSPVGTSFSFQLTDKAGDLEYTRLLREEMQIVQEKIESAIRMMNVALQGAKITDEVAARCKSIIKTVEDRLLAPVQSGIKSISTLGIVVPDGSGGSMLANSRDYWLEAKRKFDTHATAERRFDVSAEVQEGVRRVVDSIEQMHLVGDATHDDQAPVPTGFRVQFDRDGAINFYLSSPRPVAEAHRQWLRLYFDINKVLSGLVASSYHLVRFDKAGNMVLVEKHPDTLTTTDGPLRMTKPHVEIEGDAASKLRLLMTRRDEDWKGAVRSAPTLEKAMQVGLVHDIMTEMSMDGGRPLFFVGKETQPVLKPVADIPSNEQLEQQGMSLYAVVSGIALSDGTVAMNDIRHPRYGKVRFLLDDDMREATRQHSEQTRKIASGTIVRLDQARQQIQQAISGGLDERVGNNIIANISLYEKYLREALVDAQVTAREATHGRFFLHTSASSEHDTGIEGINAAYQAAAREIGLSDLAHISQHGHVTARLPKDDPESIELASHLSDVMENSRSESERSMLEAMATFPKEGTVKDMVATLNDLIAKSSQTRGDQICVPLVGSAGKPLTKLLTMQFGADIPEDLTDVVADALEPTT